MPGQTGSTINRHIGAGQVGARKQSTSLRDKVYQYEACNTNVGLAGLTPYALPLGTTGVTNRAVFPGGEAIYHVKGAGQSILGPVYDEAVGRLSVAGDQIVDEGYEYVFDGGLGAAGRHTYTVGVSNPMFAKLNFTIEDVSGLDDCAFGFREIDAFNAALDAYTDLACLNMISGNIFVETITDDAATQSEDTTINWADGETHTLMLTVGESGFPLGTVRFFIDGEQTGVLPHAFVDTLIVVPFFFFLHDATTPGDIWWNWFEIGEIRDVERAI